MVTARKSILVVEDDADTRAILAQVLEEDLGYEVRVARDGADALAQLGAGARPHLVLLDLLMPGIDGVEFLRRLRQDPDPAVAATPVVVMTALTGGADRVRDLDPDGYLAKPFGIGRLRTAISRLVP